MKSIIIAGTNLSVRSKGRNAEGRTEYAVRIRLPDGRMFKEENMKSGCQGGTEQEGLESLLSFLSAAAESYPDGENADLFDPAIVEWAHENQNDIDLERID